MTFIGDASSRFGSRPAIITAKEEITYSELNQLLKKPSDNPIIKQLSKLQENPSAIYIPTSGTTSKPKIAHLTQETLISSAYSVNEKLQITKHDRYLLALPLNHVAGLAILYRCALSGAAIVTDIKDATVASFVSTQLTRLDRADIAHLRAILVGGGPLPSYNDPRIHTSYGMTEMSSTIAINGEILPHCELKIGNHGEILVRGASLFLGYIGMNNAVDSRGWFHTNDLGEIKNGKLTILGRNDRTIISGGENVSPERIEMELQKIPGIIKSHVYGKSDPEWGQRVEVVVISSVVITSKELKSTLSEILKPSHIPKKWEIVVLQA